MRRWISVVLIIALLAGPARPAAAWNKAGHMVSGAFAYSALKEKDPEALARVIEILEAHPQYESRWSDILDHASERQQDQVLFMLAARWPDDVRETDEDRPTQHYVNKPIVIGDATPPDSVGGDIEVAFRSALHTLRDANKSDAEKAVALCWLFHLTGDIHQPLHAATLIRSDFPEGDRGGTRFYVKKSQSSAPLSLHQLWDGIILGSESQQAVRNESIKLRTAYSRDSLSAELGSGFTDTDFAKWIDESLNAAKKGYNDGTLKGGTTKGKAKTLPNNYTTEALPVAEKRMALAGYRLADILDSLFN
jgi:hypothetical protein